MTKDMAYEVFGLTPDASKEEIQKAYAQLSKQYHPEENPEEFQRIHEAYRILIRGSRGRRQVENVEYSMDDETEESVPQYDFDEAERKAHQEVYLVELQNAMDKLDDIIGIIMKKSVNEYTLKGQLEKLPIEIILSPQYVGKLYEILKDRFVDDECHEFLIEYLHLYDEELLETYEYLANFKEFIDQKKVEYWLPEVRNRRVYSLLAFLIGTVVLAVFCFVMASN